MPSSSPLAATDATVLLANCHNVVSLAKAWEPPPMIHNGSCHCGKVAFTVEGDIEQVIDCNCSHCRRKGYLLWFTSRDKLTLSTPESALATYTFNKHVIKHSFCPDCGCAPFGFGRDKQGNEVAAVNVRCLPDLELSTLKIVPIDGRSA